ncbi:MAG: transglycosylase domain-containing protein [Clostridiales bacterium]|nr:transglycosylase domain-containing protein [Clostridiales bacterium]
MDYSKLNNVKQRKRIRSKKTKVKNKAFTITLRVLAAVILVAVFAGAGAGFGMYLGIIENAPKLSVIDIKPSIYPSIIYDPATGREIDRLRGEENREYVTIDKMSEQLKNAFIAIEDERFYNHNGIDLRGMTRAVFNNLTSDTVEGASTITQQLIKNNVMKIQRNTFESKLQEQYLAMEYEKNLAAPNMYGNVKAAKDHILEVYLNTISLHYNLNGVQTGANYYFNKDVSELTLSECAVLAAIVKSPPKYNPISGQESNAERRQLVLNNMLRLGMITAAEHKTALEDDVYARISQFQRVTEERESIHSYFVDYLIANIAEDLAELKNISLTEAFYMVYNAGLQIYPTIDVNMQNIMDESFKNEEFYPASDFELDVQYTIAMRNKLTGKVRNEYQRGTVKDETQIEALVEEYRGKHMGPDDEMVAEKIVPVPQPQCAMVIIDYHNGHVKAVTGGRGEKIANLALNRATDSPRQPGSVFKVLASYAPAIDLGKVTPATVLDDTPVTYPEYDNYTPRNWYERSTGYRGLNSVRLGIIDSMNVITVKNMYNTGIDACFDYLVNFGFTTLVDKPTAENDYSTDKGPATALGGLTDGVTQLEIAAAFGTIANGGVYNKPIFYTQVLDHEGKVLLENTPEPRQVLKATSAYLLTDMMEEVLTRGTGGKARFKESAMPVAGKTGTTTDTKDLVFAGYTPYYAASIWLGFDYPKTITQDSGYQMYLWSDVMEKVHAELPVKQFERPEGIVSRDVCMDSGKLAVPGLCDHDPRGSRIRGEIFANGTQPTEYCDVHMSYTINTATGLIASPYCPAELVETRVGIVRPEPYTGDAPVRDRQYEVPQAVLNGQVCDVHGPGGYMGNSTEGGFGDSDYYIPPDYYDTGETDNSDWYIPAQPGSDVLGPEVPAQGGGGRTFYDETSTPPPQVILPPIGANFPAREVPDEGEPGAAEHEYEYEEYDEDTGGSVSIDSFSY